MLLIRKKRISEKKNNIYIWAITKLKTNVYLVNFRDIILLKCFFQYISYSKQTKSPYTTLYNPVNVISIRSIYPWPTFKLPVSKIKVPDTQFTLFTYRNKSEWVFIRLFQFYTTFFQVFDLYKKKLVYIAGPGNYILNMKHNKKKKILIFLLPSKKQLVASEWVIGLQGQNGLNLLKKHIPAFNKNKLKIKKQSVRGVAKNPVDHHNGGRSNRKPLFLNKYNKIAKFNK